MCVNVWVCSVSESMRVCGCATCTCKSVGGGVHGCVSVHLWAICKCVGESVCMCGGYVCVYELCICENACVRLCESMHVYGVCASV